MNFLNILEDVLKRDQRFVADDGKLLKPIIHANAMNMDKNLISLLISNEEIRSHFFTDVDGVLVFDKVKFTWVVGSREFLPDSYTRYGNKIGLVDNSGNLISAKGDVTLVWPYKDCVLAGGQTKDDQKRDEIFYNETLAPDEVKRLLHPKVLTNAKRYSKDGVEDITTFDDKDNLIIKGNNLLALSSLLKRYEGKVKCIYIDPPYNTGNDSFNYNDNFNHSSWLTFMKNRLELAKKLLSDDGAIFIHCDRNEFAELNLLSKSIFNDSLATIVTNATPHGRDYGFFAQTHEYIHVFAKDEKKVELFPLFDANDRKYNKKDSMGVYYLHPLFNSNSNFSIENRPNLYYPFYVSQTQNAEGYYDIQLKSHEDCLPVFPPKSQTDGTQFVWRWGKEKSENNINNEIVGQKMSNGEFRIAQKMRNNGSLPRTIWSDTSFSNRRGTEQLQSLFGEKIFAYPKSEELLERILEISTNTNDLVLDFHLGSGTTAAVAHKMGRQYIGIEQMDYINTVTVPRLQKVIEGEQGGISKDVNWQGGGSFVYCELKELNEAYVKEIQVATTKEQLEDIKSEIITSGFISHKVNIKEIAEKDAEFDDLTLAQQKQLLMELINKNKLYVNYSEIDDEDMNVSNDDKAFTHSFYKRGI